MWKLFRAMRYWVRGIFNRQAESLAENAAVMEATYDASIEKQDIRYHELKRVISKMVTSNKMRVSEVQGLTGEIDALEKSKAGAFAQGKKRAEQLKAEGKTKEQIAADPEWSRCMNGFEKASTGLKDKAARIAKLEQDIAKDEPIRAQYITELTNIQAKKRSLEEEKNEALADVAVAKDREETQDLLNGVSKDTTDQDLATARKARLNSQARAEVAAEVSGASFDGQMAGFAAYGESSAAKNEFLSMMGIEDEEEKQAAEPAKLPEN